MIPARPIAGDIGQAHLTFLPEIDARRARGGVEGNQSPVKSGFEDPASARLARTARRIKPGRDAAVDEAVSVRKCQINFRVISPALRAGLWVKRDDAIERGSEIKRPIDQNRSGLKSAPAPVMAALRNIPSVVNPGDLQGLHVLSVDLRKRRIPRASEIVSVIRPVVYGTTKTDKSMTHPPSDGWQRELLRLTF